MHLSKKYIIEHLNQIRKKNERRGEKMETSFIHVTKEGRQFYIKADQKLRKRSILKSLKNQGL